eukprot:TRINITY_DN32915_c0_g1_i1.p1 TRINITY_DN32915_c0_g1~~TRINITY_DN32915_c0_g1_i1.p1  ORF type:complete len:362 (+),score=48.46 TRINITY_DN32915_c0_g1_i1:158-1243(+)
MAPVSRRRAARNCGKHRTHAIDVPTNRADGKLSTLQHRRAVYSIARSLLKLWYRNGTPKNPAARVSVIWKAILRGVQVELGKMTRAIALTCLALAFKPVRRADPELLDTTSPGTDCGLLESDTVEQGVAEYLEPSRKEHLEDSEENAAKKTSRQKENSENGDEDGTVNEDSKQKERTEHEQRPQATETSQTAVASTWSWRTDLAFRDFLLDHSGVVPKLQAPYLLKAYLPKRQELLHHPLKTARLTALSCIRDSVNEVSRKPSAAVTALPLCPYPSTTPRSNTGEFELSRTSRWMVVGGQQVLVDEKKVHTSPMVTARNVQNSAPPLLQLRTDTVSDKRHARKVRALRSAALHASRAMTID